MKKVSLLILSMIIGANLFSQSDFKINLITSYDHSVLDIGPSERFYNIEYSKEKDFGYTIDLGIEAKTGVSSSIVLGIKSSKKVYNPDQEILLFYGGRLSYGGDTLNVSAPHLKRLEYQTISLPIYHKHYFVTKNEFSFYAIIGGSAELRIKAKETYLDYRYDRGEIIEYGKISAVEKELKLFGTSIEVGGGFNRKLSNRLALTFQANFHLFEFRRSNDRLMVIWPEVGLSPDQLWEDDFLALGQVSFGLGLQIDLSRKDSF